MSGQGGGKRARLHGEEPVEAAEPDTTENRNKSSGRARQIGGKLAKAVYKVSAADVLTRDIKRIKPRFPNLWSDILSGKWRSAETDTKKRPANVAFAVSMICGLLTAAFAAYSYVVLLTAK